MLLVRKIIKEILRHECIVYLVKLLFRDVLNRLFLLFFLDLVAYARPCSLIVVDSPRVRRREKVQHLFVRLFLTAAAARIQTARHRKHRSRRHRQHQYPVFLSDRSFRHCQVLRIILHNYRALSFFFTALILSIILSCTSSTVNCISSQFTLALSS